MKTTFHYDQEAALSLALKYSDAPDTLRALISRLQITVGAPSVILSPWSDSKHQLKALQMWVEINGYGFPYYGSHNDAEAHAPLAFFDGAAKRERAEKLKAFRDGLLYSLLCSVRCDYYADNDPEEIGLNPDSIKDMAKFNEIREHTRNLRAALKLTAEELNSLPS